MLIRCVLHPMHLESAVADKREIARYRCWYRRLLRLYPSPYRERFGEGMEQTFNDLCRERIRADQGLVWLAIWVYVETAVGIVRENATSIRRRTMKHDSIASLKIVKYSAITLGVLMAAGIVTLMILARGKGEDITGIVAPALLLTLVSGVVAAVAGVLQRRALKTMSK